MEPVNGHPATARSVAALLFLTAGMTTFDAYSTLMSSPWTAENVGADPEKARSIREYVHHAVVFSTIYAVASSVLAGSLWPLVGASTSNAYLWWVYNRATERAEATGYTGGWLKPNTRQASSDWRS